MIWKQAETLSSMSSTSTTDYSQKISEADVIEVEGDARPFTQPSKRNNNAHDHVQSYEGKPLTDEEWMSRHNEK